MVTKQDFLPGFLVLRYADPYGALLKNLDQARASILSKRKLLSKKLRAMLLEKVPLISVPPAMEASAKKYLAYRGIRALCVCN